MTTPQSSAPIGSRQELREVALESLGMAAIQAQLGAQYAHIGDDAGLQYAVRKLVAYTRLAIGVVGDLKSAESKEHRQ
jgi:hypothetical protein